MIYECNNVNVFIVYRLDRYVYSFAQLVITELNNLKQQIVHTLIDIDLVTRSQLYDQAYQITVRYFNNVARKNLLSALNTDGNAKDIIGLT